MCIITLFAVTVSAQELTGSVNLVPSDEDGGAEGTRFVSKFCHMSEARVEYEIHNNFLAYTSADFVTTLQCNKDTPTTKGHPALPGGTSSVQTIRPLVGGVRNKACYLRLFGQNPVTGDMELFDTQALDCGVVIDDDDDDDGCAYDDDDNDGFFDIPGHIEHQNASHSLMLWVIGFVVLLGVYAAYAIWDVSWERLQLAKQTSETQAKGSSSTKRKQQQAYTRWNTVKEDAKTYFSEVR